jgi:hypothetical protein
MKTLFTLLIIAASFTPAARAGWENGNAGDAFSAEFLYSGRDLLQRLELLAANREGLPIDTRKLRTAMENATVVSEEKVFLDGLERDAVSYPSKRLVKISRSRWRELRRSEETRARLTLVLHEFLWLSGIDDTNFAQSMPVIEKLNVPPYSPSIWLNTPGRAFAMVECTGQLKDRTFVTVILNTKGATKAPDHGEVQFEKDGFKHGYRFTAREVAQFFEFDDSENGKATVGLSAYVKGEFPVQAKYEGPNFVDMDLKVVIETGGNRPGDSDSPRNFLRVWKGPRFGAEDIVRMENPVCAVGTNN